MPEPNRDLSELKKEVVETRNQSIKTDNLVKNLSLDIKNIDKRFTQLEKRTRMASVGSHIIVVAVVLGAAYLVHSVRVNFLQEAVESGKAEVESTHARATARVSEAQKQLGATRSQAERRVTVEQKVAALLDHLDAGRDKQAAELLGGLRLDDLGPLALRLTEKRFAEFRKRSAVTAYKSARVHLSAGRTKVALADLRLSLKLVPDGKYATPARYLLATNLWTAKRWDEAIPILREMQRRDGDKALRVEMRFLLACALARSEKREEAAVLFEQVLAENGRYVVAARTYLAAIASGGALPPLSGSKTARATNATVSGGGRATR
ncbi:MAG: hypothetical protein V3T05_07090 [Myxococcota bacterium]